MQFRPSGDAKMKLFNETTKMLLIIAALGNGSRAQDNVTSSNASAVSEAGKGGVEADRANRVNSPRLGVFGGEVDDVAPGHPPAGSPSIGNRCVILGRIFNVLVEIIFKDQAYYVGPFYDAACEDLAGVKYAEIVYTSGNTNYLSTEQMSFACRGITTLYDSYFFAVQFAVVMLVAGIFAAELWLWATGLQHSQQTVSLAQTSIQIPSVGGMEDKRPLMVICNLNEELPITLVQKEAIATDAVKMRFSLPDVNSGLLIPLLGHVSLRKADMIRPRPYSPVISLEAGFVTFIVRHSPRGLLSTYMVQQMKEGQSLLLSGPMAPVIAPSLQHAKNLLLIAGGTGIAPFYSLVETTEAKCHVLMAEKDQSRTIGIQPMNENVTSEVCIGRKSLHQRLDTLLGMESEVPTVCVICGPPAFNIAVKNKIRRKGIPSFAIGTDDR
ncbi:Nitrate reductase [NADH] [Seminavis robusta]|uniref:Nitrate reductase [NADH] n=1 Tax=Seminavis robusta TaxID=568900 RepID=A0A9N8HQW8_9STRA|nr:Nitrate reductase [NADH] [Seminavis robusta]|eukprot:Sro1333_g263720.1 Nitrate reductase [NADH] (439) ;mRNA; f:26879-28405